MRSLPCASVFRTILPLFVFLLCISCSGGGGGGSDETATQPAGTATESGGTVTKPAETGTEPGGTEQVTLAWNASTSPDIQGYKLYYGTESGNYKYVKDVGNSTTDTLMNLINDVRYYFAVTAYTSAAESGFSNEVSFLPGS